MPEQIRYNNKDIWEWDEAPHEPDEPTDLQPGTKEKMILMRERVLAGQPPNSSGDRDCFQPTLIEMITEIESGTVRGTASFEDVEPEYSSSSDIYSP